MNLLLPAIIIMIPLSIIFFIIGLTQSKKENVLLRFKRLFPKDQDVLASLEEERFKRPFFERVIHPLISKLAGHFAGRFEGVSRLEALLIQAGNPGSLVPEEFVTIQLICAVLLAVLILVISFLLPLRPIFVFVLTCCGIGLGYLLPKFWLGRQVKRRKSKIQCSLPDILDLLCICLEAGLGFDLALAKVVEKSKGPLAMEFKRALQEMVIGRPRREALKDVSKRCDVEDLRVFVNEIIQAEQLGVSMNNILRIQSDHMRVKRRQRAEEIAMKAPIKILFPMIFFIFPTIFIIILGPVALKVIQELGLKP